VLVATNVSPIVADIAVVPMQIPLVRVDVALVVARIAHVGVAVGAISVGKSSR
jgi:hypothetical protein